MILTYVLALALAGAAVRMWAPEDTGDYRRLCAGRRKLEGCRLAEGEEPGSNIPSNDSRYLVPLRPFMPSVAPATARVSGRGTLNVSSCPGKRERSGTWPAEE